MKQKTKNTAFKLSGLLIIFAALIFVSPIKTLAQTTGVVPNGSPDNGDPTQCQSGNADSQSICIPQSGTASGSNCALPSQCGPNQTCYQAAGATGPTCQIGTAGLPCQTSNNCGAGLSCSSSGQCAVSTSFTSYSQCVSKTTNLAANPQGSCCQYFPNDPACVNLNNPNAPTNPTGATGGCPTGLQQVNGLCLPPNPYNTGVASQKSLTGLLILVIQFLLDFAGIVSVVVLIVGGFWYITSSGSEEQAEKGKKAIINAIIGLLVVILSYAIVTIISGTLTTNNFLAH